MKKLKKPFFLLAYLAIIVITLSALSPVIHAESNKENGKTYEIATDITFAPFEYKNTEGEYVGIDIDLLKAIAKDQGFNVKIKPLGFNAAVQALESKQVDGVIAGMSITDERKKKFDFSDPYFDSGVVMAVKEGNEEIKSYKDLNGKKVAVKTGTEGASFANSIKDKYNFKIVTFDESSTMYEDVKIGNSAATFDDYPVIAHGVTQDNGLALVTEKEKGGSYGFAVSKGENQELLEKFNKGLAELKASGEYKQITDKYLKADNTEDKSFLGLIKSNYPDLLKGLGMTLLLTVVSILFALILGIVFGLMKVTKNKILNAIGSIYVDIFRGTPLIVQAFFIYFGLPLALDFRISAIAAGLITLSLNAGAYMAEIVRGGVESVDKGQMEAARSLGLPYKKAMQKVVLPQAIRLMIPSFINQFIITLKDTSILSIIGLNELTQSGKIIIARNLESFKMWLIIGLMYFIIIMILTKLSNRLEKRIQNGKA